MAADARRRLLAANGRVDRYVYGRPGVIDWRPGSDWPVAARRAKLLERVRGYFAAQDVLAVDTPTLWTATVTDPMIESIATADGRYLATSPEFAMKRLLAAGYPDICSIGRVFRGGESGRRHQPEFTMIEWYRRGFGLAEIVDDTLGLIAHALERPALRDTAGKQDYADLFTEYADVDPLEAPLEDIIAAAGADAGLCDSLGERRNAWLDLVLATVIAPRLPRDRLTVVEHYPLAQGALARRCRPTRASPTVSRYSPVRSNSQTATSSSSTRSSRPAASKPISPNAASSAFRPFRWTNRCSRRSTPGCPNARAWRWASSGCTWWPKTWMISAT